MTQETLFAAPPENILPYDGEVFYFGLVIGAEKAAFYLQRLLDTVAWKNDEAVIFGRHIVTKRKVAWYGDSSFDYKYSGKTRSALSWTPELLTLKQRVEAITGRSFNACLLNLYHTGEEGMAWHSDDEKTLVKNSAIASLSLGAARKFSFRHRKNKNTLSLLLEPGSLLSMQGVTQTHWMHALPKTKKVPGPRINCTFRTMAPGSRDPAEK